MVNEKSTAVIQLTKSRKNLIQFGAMCLTISIACYGLALSTLITPILENVNAMEYVGLFSVLGSLGITIMTPIGGKLGDIFGKCSVTCHTTQTSNSVSVHFNIRIYSFRKD